MSKHKRIEKKYTFGKLPNIFSFLLNVYHALSSRQLKYMYKNLCSHFFAKV